MEHLIPVTGRGRARSAGAALRKVRLARKVWRPASMRARSGGAAARDEPGGRGRGAQRHRAAAARAGQPHLRRRAARAPAQRWSSGRAAPGAPAWHAGASAAGGSAPTAGQAPVLRAHGGHGCVRRPTPCLSRRAPPAWPLDPSLTLTSTRADPSRYAIGGLLMPWQFSVNGKHHLLALYGRRAPCAARQDSRPLGTAGLASLNCCGHAAHACSARVPRGGRGAPRGRPGGRGPARGRRAGLPGVAAAQRRARGRLGRAALRHVSACAQAHGPPRRTLLVACASSTRSMPAFARVRAGRSSSGCCSTPARRCSLATGASTPTSSRGTGECSRLACCPLTGSPSETQRPGMSCCAWRAVRLVHRRVVLLHGPPGSGKTSLCKALAHKLAIRFSHRWGGAGQGVPRRERWGPGLVVELGAALTRRPRAGTAPARWSR